MTLTRLAPFAVLALALAACGGEEATPPVGTSSPTAATSTSAEPTEPAEPELAGDLVVFAAASLTDTFDELGAAFEAANPGVTVTFNYAGSSALAQQVLSGAPADVLATASPATMALVVDGGAADGEPAVFVSNLLQIAVPADNPGMVEGLMDFADEALTIALCAVEVPCGAAAEQVFTAAGIVAAPDTFEQDVRAALTKVELGEVDAALVYRTDVLVAGDAVQGIEFPEASEAVNDYPVVALAEAPNADAAAAFVEFVLSSEAAAVFTEAGFEVP